MFWLQSSDHPEVLKKLLEKGTKDKKDMNKYVELVVAHSSNSKWLTKSESLLVHVSLALKLEIDQHKQLRELKGKLF